MMARWPDVATLGLTGWQSFDNEQPPPGLQPSSAVHVPHAISNAPPEGPRQRRAAHERRYPRRPLPLAVPEAEVVDHAREDAGLAGAKEEAEGRDPRAVRRAADARAERAESHDEEREPPVTLGDDR